MTSDGYDLDEQLKKEIEYFQETGKVMDDFFLPPALPPAKIPKKKKKCVAKRTNRPASHEGHHTDAWYVVVLTRGRKIENLGLCFAHNESAAKALALSMFRTMDIERVSAYELSALDMRTGRWTFGKEK